MVVLFIFGIIALYFTYLEDIGKKENGLKIGIFIVTFLAAIHCNYGSDYPVYFSNYKFFINYDFSFLEVITGNYDERANENGWLLLMWLVRPLGVSGFYVLVALISIFQGAVVYQLIKRYVPNGWKVFALFIYLFNTNLYVGSMSGLRQNTAMAIIGCTLPLILNRKYIYSVIIIILASSIHKSALVFLPFVFWGLITPKMRKVIVFAFLLIIMVLYTFKEYIQVLLTWFFSFDEFQMYEGYTNRHVDATYGIGFLLALIPVFLSMLFIWKANNNKKIFCIVSLAAVSYVLMPIANNVGLASRIAYYFEFFSIIALPYCYSYVKKRTVRIVLLSLFILLYIYSYYNYFFLPERYHSTYTYRSLFQLL